MEISPNLIVSILAGMFSASMALVTYLVVKPLNEAIAGLRQSIERLTEKAENNNAEINELRERASKVEEVAKSAHKRLDTLNDRVNICEEKCKCRS